MYIRDIIVDFETIATQNYFSVISWTLDFELTFSIGSSQLTL